MELLKEIVPHLTASGSPSSLAIASGPGKVGRTSSRDAVVGVEVTPTLVCQESRRRYSNNPLVAARNMFSTFDPETNNVASPLGEFMQGGEFEKTSP